MTGDTVLLAPHDRETVERACQEHCDHRGWTLLVANARTNHVHVVLMADAAPKTVTDQLKANCTRCLRKQTQPMNRPKTWTKGGDIEVLDTDDDMESAVLYVTEAQDRKDRDMSRRR
jgi:REP element-mobilizing transposase RayT